MAEARKNEGLSSQATVKGNFCTRKYRKVKANQGGRSSFQVLSNRAGLYVGSRIYLNQTEAAEQCPERDGAELGPQEDTLTLKPSRQSKLMRKLTATTVALTSEAVSISGRQ